MTDLEQAKMLLLENNFTCVLCKGDQVFTSSKRGIAPMVDFITAKTDLKGFSAADKIVGKAAAMLFVLVGVCDVYGQTMSKPAVQIFQQYHIDYSCATLTGTIINRKGTGPCPMEEAVADISDPAEALAAIQKVLHTIVEIK